jgi:hypothetical protein
MSAREKIAYLRGLIEGQSLTENTGMTKFQEALLGALDAIVEEIEDIAGAQDDLREYVEDLDDEVMSMTTGSSKNDAAGGTGYELGDADYDDEEEYEPITCPGCGKDFFYQPNAYDDDEDLLCPHCGEPFKQ